MTQEERLRCLGVKRHQAGEPVTAICRSLGRSRVWLYRWLGRFGSGQQDWYRSRSRRPKHSGRSLPRDMEAAILASRRRLDRADLFCGAQAIAWDLEDQGLDGVPSERTIARVLACHQITSRRKGRYCPKGTSYPSFWQKTPGQVQQTDFVGPCYLQGGIRFYSLHSIDIAINHCAIEPLPRLTDAMDAIWKSWLRIGMPRYQQIDNALIFFGSPRHPRGMGKLIRLCLHHEIEPIFIPIGAPWRNGVVEKFNNHWRQKFFMRTVMKDLPELRQQSLAYERRHNERYRYSKLGGQTPLQALHRSGMTPRYPLSDQPPGKLDKPETGRYHVIRLIRSDGLLDVFTEKFQMPPEAMYEYVVATVNVDRQKLEIRLGANPIEEIDYLLR